MLGSVQNPSLYQKLRAESRTKPREKVPGLAGATHEARDTGSPPGAHLGGGPGL